MCIRDRWWIARKFQFFLHPSWIGFLLILLCSVVLCAALGFIIELLAYRPLRNQPRLTSLITAIGVSMFLEFGGQRFFGPNPQAFPSLIPGWQDNPTFVNFHGMIIDLSLIHI